MQGIMPNMAGRRSEWAERAAQRDPIKPQTDLMFLLCCHDAAEEGGNMSSRIFQNVIIQLKDAVDRTIGVVDEQGFVVASSELAMIGSRLDDFHLYEFDGTEHPVSTGSRTYCALSSPGAKFDYAAFTDGSDPMSRTICSIASVAFNEAKNNYEEKHNKAAFIKNIISPNLKLILLNLK